jgi:hypothetical protein
MGEAPNKNEWDSGQKSSNESSERNKSTVNENRSADQIRSDTRQEIDRTVPGILKKD